MKTLIAVVLLCGAAFGQQFNISTGVCTTCADYVTTQQEIEKQYQTLMTQLDEISENVDRLKAQRAAAEDFIIAMSKAEPEAFNRFVLTHPELVTRLVKAETPLKSKGK